MERETGFEPATSTLARSHSTNLVTPARFEKPSFSFTCATPVKPAAYWMLQRAEAFQMKGFIMLYPIYAFVLCCGFCSGARAGQSTENHFPSILDRA